MHGFLASCLFIWKPGGNASGEGSVCFTGILGTSGAQSREKRCYTRVSQKKNGQGVSRDARKECAALADDEFSSHHLHGSPRETQCPLLAYAGTCIHVVPIHTLNMCTYI